MNLVQPLLNSQHRSQLLTPKPQQLRPQYLATIQKTHSLKGRLR
jgi:hypothetical protein